MSVAHVGVRSVIRSIVVTSTMMLSLAAFTGCAQESLTLDLAQTDKGMPSTRPIRGHLKKGRQDFQFVLEGRSSDEKGGPAEHSTEARVTASDVLISIADMIGSLLRGQYGAVQTQTVQAYAVGTSFAVVTGANGTTYVVHLDHVKDQSVLVTMRNHGPSERITANGFVVVTASDTKIAKFTPITDNDTLAPLPANIAAEVNGLRVLLPNPVGP